MERDVVPGMGEQCNGCASQTDNPCYPCKEVWTKEVIGNCEAYRPNLETSFRDLARKVFRSVAQTTHPF